MAQWQWPRKGVAPVRPGSRPFGGSPPPAAPPAGPPPSTPGAAVESPVRTIDAPAEASPRLPVGAGPPPTSPPGMSAPAGPPPASFPPQRPSFPSTNTYDVGGLSSASEALEEIKFRVHRRLIQELETSRLNTLAEDEARAGVEAAARQILAQEAPGVFGIARDELIVAVVDEVLGLGPIQPLMRDPTISEVVVNAPDVIYFERGGRLNRANVRFRDNAHIMRIIERIISPLGRRVDESSPMVDARLADGSRVNIIIPPVAPKSPAITIRKFKADKMKMSDLVALGALSEEAALFLEACVKIRRNIIISGGTGSGKTTQLNALSGFIPETERLVTIEDPTELRLQQTHVVSLEAKPASIEGRGEVTPQHLVKNALRMRPDRIIIGECRGSEAFDMLQAMNTGHEGSLSTIHANTPRDALARIESMVLMTGLDLPLKVVRQQIASAIHLIVQVARFSDGSRKLSHITEITGMEGDVITAQDIFKFENEGLDENKRVLGVLRAQGIRPTFAPQFELAGLELPSDIFSGGMRW
ncbi:MAG: ATPase, T2SS/T4P/T4SS family [Dehalococcoidia bacterium]